MYRQNKLKEELDRLRKENERLRNEVTFWQSGTDAFQSEIRALRLELQNRDLMGRLINEISLKPIKIEDFVDKDKSE